MPQERDRDRTFPTFIKSPRTARARAASAARPASCLRPGWPRPAAAGMRWETPSMAGAVGSTALGSHFGASLEDHGPNVVLYGQVH
jgi:hypothetical protein